MSRFRRLVARGALLRLGHGVYAHAEVMERATADRVYRHCVHVAAVLLTTVPGAVGSHDSAAFVHAVELLDRPLTPDGRPASVTITRPVAAHQKPSTRVDVHVHVAGLPGDHVDLVNGVPFTTPPRTAVDLIRQRAFRDAVVVADSVLASRKYEVPITKADLFDIVGGQYGWPGIGPARAVIEFARTDIAGPIESLGRVAFHEAGLPSPETGVWLSLGGRRVWPDFLWRAQWTIAEADGEAKYGIRPSKAAEELHRHYLLQEAGYEVVHYTWREITNKPERVAARVRAAFDRR